MGQTSDINTKNSDINGDGRINTADLFALRKIINS
jgi:endoglucanase